MAYRIALNFEDGITRFIEANPGETVADASYRVGINIPLDCRDGACGTCKGFCESGQYDNGSYIEDAMTEEEAAEGYVLACQMKPQSDCVVRIAATSNVCKTGVSSYKGADQRDRSPLADNDQLLPEAGGRAAAHVLAGAVRQHRCSGQRRAEALVLVQLVAARARGLVPDPRTPRAAFCRTYMRDKAQVGAPLEFTGPVGSFYLREIRRPLLFLAGGTGLAPFLAMLETMSHTGSKYPVHLIYGVTNDPDLVHVDKLQEYAHRLPKFTFACCVADEGSAYPNKGYVTRYIEPQHMHDGDVDVYLCGPPAMVDAVRNRHERAGHDRDELLLREVREQRRGHSHRRGAVMMHHPDRFKGKVAVVTGAAQGIGRIVAVNLAKEGGQVALVDRSEVVNETHEEIAAAGAELGRNPGRSRAYTAMPAGSWPKRRSASGASTS